MEQYKNCSARNPNAYAPASPCRRHIHSSFPHYFYSTPAAPPSSHSISAFVALCESRLVPEVDDGFASASVSVSENYHHVPAAAPVSSSTTTVAPPKEATTARPLKPPPRLQYIANIRRSLRNSIPAGLRRSSLRGGGGGGGGSRAPKPSNSGVVRRKDGADPFAAAAHKVAGEEDAPWCRLPWRRNRKSKVAREAAKAGAAAAATKSEDGMNDQAEAATSKSRRKGSWILRMLRTAIKGKEKESSSDSKKEEEEEEEEDHAKNGQLVGLVKCTTVSRRRRVLVRRRTSGSLRRRQF
ncbi:uncharacterized protein M6B38_252370 [Iris pallida]|uniref:Uncharacterized protein n=1 Tax=Iris pallida TaxID=29817 RepID=A0AAX6IJE9_IRIPA|nr:uncharacterized protein M6B38_252370 [Iris pallida]